MTDEKDTFVRLWRSTKNSKLWKLRSEDFKVAMCLIMNANWKDGEWFDGMNLVEIKRGQWVTSVEKLAEDTKLSIQTIRTSLKHLEKIEFLTKSSTKRYTHINILNYGRYNDKGVEPNKESNEEPTDNQQAPNKEPTTIEEGVEGKEETQSMFPEEEKEQRSKWMKDYPDYHIEIANHCWDYWTKNVKPSNEDSSRDRMKGYICRLLKDGVYPLKIKQAIRNQELLMKKDDTPYKLRKNGGNFFSPEGGSWEQVSEIYIGEPEQEGEEDDGTESLKAMAEADKLTYTPRKECMK